ncbi:hypothetical protein CIG19_09145 [Enterobacterales bacterium CwR94]|nr:hypothetical protein CIG19_09145 [Enterobacterales bacterium CwR94]
MISIRNLTSVLFTFVVLLAIVWPIPNELLPFHRNLFIYSAFIIALGLYFHNQIDVDYRSGKIRWLIIILVTISIYGLIIGLLYSPNIKLMLKNWNGMWVRPVMLFFLGLYIYPILKREFTTLTPERFISIIVLCFFISPALHVIDTLLFYFENSYIPWGETRLFRTRTELSIQINMIAVILIAEALRRAFKHQPALVFNNLSLVLMIAIIGISTALANTRFGTIGLTAGMFSMIFLILLKELNRKNLFKMSIIVTAITIAIAILGYSSFKKDPRWHTLKEDVTAGWDAPVKSYCFELNPSSPQLKRGDGEPVDTSNACRPAYIHQALELIAYYPMGIGAGKSVYLNLLQKNHPTANINISQSHSGLLELAMQYGVFGLIAWLTFNIIIILQAWRSYTRSNDKIALFSLIFTIGFLSRSLIDRNLIDHFFEQFMFVSAVLLSITWIKDHSK